MPMAALSQVIDQAIAGGLIGFPTDTVPGLAVRPEQATAIYAAKQRQPDKPLILMAAAAADLWPYVAGSAAARSIWQQVGDRHWPGALTLVLPASPTVPTAMNPQHRDTIGLRVPNHPVARHILAQTGPLATTSVNRSGQPPLLNPAAIVTAFPEVWVVDPAESFAAQGVRWPLWSEQWLPATAGQPSTVAQWTTAGNWEILRAGAIAIAS